jgi:hypothetical protein
MIENDEQMKSVEDQIVILAKTISEAYKNPDRTDKDNVCINSIVGYDIIQISKHQRSIQRFLSKKEF